MHAIADFDVIRGFKEVQLNIKEQNEILKQISVNIHIMEPNNWIV